MRFAWTNQKQLVLPPPPFPSLQAQLTPSYLQLEQIDVGKLSHWDFHGPIKTPTPSPLPFTPSNRKAQKSPDPILPSIGANRCGKAESLRFPWTNQITFPSPPTYGCPIGKLQWPPSHLLLEQIDVGKLSRWGFQSCRASIWNPRWAKVFRGIPPTFGDFGDVLGAYKSGTEILIITFFTLYTYIYIYEIIQYTKKYQT